MTTFSQVSKLRRMRKLRERNVIIHNQLQEGVIKSPTLRERVVHAHRGLIRETIPSAEIGLLRWGRKDGTYCVASGHALRNKIYHVLIFERSRSVAFTTDIKIFSCKFALLEGKSDALRFHYLCDLHSAEIRILRFAMAPFCLTPSPFP